LIFYDKLVDSANNYILFKNNRCYEYSKSKLYSEANVLWKSCTEYSLVFNYILNENPLKKGDTMNIELKGIVKDTILGQASFQKDTLKLIFVILK
jgi:hypothetical protein